MLIFGSRYFIPGRHLVAGVPGRIQNATGDLVIDAITIAFQETKMERVKPAYLMMHEDMGVSLNGGTPKTPQNDHV